MKILDIAFKDIQRALRSGFGVVMMFIVPIMIPGYYLRGVWRYVDRQLDGGNNFNLSVTRVVVANLDRGHGSIGGRDPDRISAEQRPADTADDHGRG